MVTISDMTGQNIIEKVISNIENNYEKNRHSLTGFYNEELVHSDGRVFEYGEGVILSLKEKYRNNLSLKNLSNLQSKEKNIFIKGFFHDFDHFLYDQEKNLFKFPNVTQGGTLSRMLDLFKSPFSLLAKEHQSSYDFNITGYTPLGDEDGLIIAFSPKDSLGIFEGEIVVNSDNYAIHSAIYKPTQKAKNIFQETNKNVSLLDRTYKIDYNKNGEQYILTNAIVESRFKFDPTGDVLFNKLVYTTTDFEVGKYKIKKNDIIIGINDAMNRYVPDSASYYKDNDVILRTEEVQKALDKVKPKSKKAYNIDFTTRSLKKAFELAQKEEKLIFVDVTASWCGPCKKMESSTFRDSAFSSVINDQYIPLQLNFDSHKNSQLMRLTDTRSIPTLMVLSPWGEAMFTKRGYTTDTKSYQVPFSEIAEKVSVEHIFNALDTMDNQTDATGSIMLYPQLLTSVFADKSLYIRTLLGSKNKWNTKEKLDIIFNILQYTMDIEMVDYFAENITQFSSQFPGKKLDKIIYNVAVFNSFYSKWTPNQSLEFISNNVGLDKDYYNALFQIDYYRMVTKDNIKVLEATLSLLSDFPVKWDEAKTHFIDILLKNDDKEDIKKIMLVLNKYKANSIDYEWLDLQCLAKFKLGQEEEALAMINDILNMALADGIKYKCAIYMWKEQQN